MTVDEFKASLSRETPAQDLSPALQALWWAGKDDWDRAHKIVMDASGAEPAWVHAYLHRVEGDLGNARYWYNQAGQPPADGSLPEEWGAIVSALLTR
jgi:hypothetical protein